MELSKEVYTTSPDKGSKVQSAVNSIMKDEKIVGKKVAKTNNLNKDLHDEKVPEKKRRGRPPKNPTNNLQTTETMSESTNKNETVIKKPRGRPRKKKEPEPTTTTDNTIPPDNNIPPDDNNNHSISSILQTINTHHNLSNIPHKTLKYIIFLIHLFHHTPHNHLLHHLPLHTLIHHTLTHFHHSQLHTTTPHITHALLSLSS